MKKPIPQSVLMRADKVIKQNEILRISSGQVFDFSLRGRFSILVRGAACRTYVGADLRVGPPNGRTLERKKSPWLIAGWKTRALVSATTIA